MRIYELMLIMGSLYWSCHCIGSQEKTDDSSYLHKAYGLFGSGFSFALSATSEQKVDPLLKEIATEYAKKTTREEKQQYLQSIASLTQKYPEWLSLIPQNNLLINEDPTREASPDPRHESLEEMTKEAQK